MNISFLTVLILKVSTRTRTRTTRTTNTLLGPRSLRCSRSKTVVSRVFNCKGVWRYTCGQTQVEDLLYRYKKNCLLPASASNCPGGWEVNYGKCYKAVHDALEWDRAMDKCSEMGAILAEPKSSDENTFVASLMEKSIWIGLNDRKSEAT